MNISQHGIDLIKKFEGLRLVAYFDAIMVPTVGYGHTKTVTRQDVLNKKRITEAQAEALLKSDVAEFVAGVNSLVKVPLTQNQFDALVSFSYNVGLGNLKSSTLLKKVNIGDHISAASQFIRWNKAGGRELAGLTTRRKLEAQLYTS